MQPAAALLDAAPDLHAEDAPEPVPYHDGEEMKCLRCGGPCFYHYKGFVGECCWRKEMSQAEMVAIDAQEMLAEIVRKRDWSRLDVVIEKLEAARDADRSQGWREANLELFGA